MVDKSFAVIDTDNSLKGEFKKYLGQAEIYKFLSDIVDSSQNILLVADGAIAELPEIMDTYTDTWGKMVRYLEVKKYVNGGDTIYSITPDFETLQYTEIVGEPADEEVEEIERPKYSEEYHLDGVSDFSKEIYTRIKNIAFSVDKTLVFNPQKYYISIKANKNIAFIQIRKKKVRFIVMMPEEEIRRCIKRYPVASLSAPVQVFYNGPCACVDMSNIDGVDELPALIHRMIEYNQGH